ncbi:MAG: hypothetical protein AAF598_16225, partial [Bacteroidota bacterium]
MRQLLLSVSLCLCFHLTLAQGWEYFFGPFCSGQTSYSTLDMAELANGDILLLVSFQQDQFIQPIKQIMRFSSNGSYLGNIEQFFGFQSILSVGELAVSATGRIAAMVDESSCSLACLHQYDQQFSKIWFPPINPTPLEPGYPLGLGKGIAIAFDHQGNLVILTQDYLDEEYVLTKLSPQGNIIWTLSLLDPGTTGQSFNDLIITATNDILL